MTRSQLSAVVLAAFAAIALPQPADAQLGGLIKKKVTEAVKPPEKPTTAPSPSPGQRPGTKGYPPGFGSDVLYITKPYLEATLRGMDAELAMREEFKKELAKYPTPQQYQACQTNASMTPEGQKIMGAIANVPKNATAEEFQRIMAKMASDMEAHLKRACPLDPNDWIDHKKRERLAEIRLKAAAIAFPAPTASGPPNPTGRDLGDLLFEARFFEENEGVERFENPATAAPDTIVSPDQALKLSIHWYAIMIERIDAFCDYVLDGGAVGFGSGEGLKFPGEGKDIFWVYTASELKLLESVDCEKFLKKYHDLLK